MAEDYKGNSEVGFPNFEETPESVKQTPGYSLSVAKAIVYKHNKGLTAISPSWNNAFKELRDYGAGKQSVDRYKTFMSSASSSNSTEANDDPVYNNRDAARKGWWNVNWDNSVSFIPNIKSQILGFFNTLDFDLRCDAIDVSAGAMEEMRMLQAYIDTHKTTGSLINDLKKTANLPVEEPNIVPEGMDELEDLKKDGYFKEEQIKAHEKLLLHTENLSLWDRYLKDEVLNDILDIGYIAVYPEFSDETAVPVWKYANPAEVVMQYDQDNGFRNSDYQAVPERWTISQLKQYRNYIVDKRGNPITEEGFKHIAKLYCGKDTNPGVDIFNKGGESQYGYFYDDWKIKIWKCFWRDVEYIKRIKYYNKYGKMRMYDYKEPIEKEYDVQAGSNSFDYPYDMGDNYSLNVMPMDGTKVAKKTKRRNGFDVIANTPGRVKVEAKINIGSSEKLQSVRVRKVYYCYYIDGTDYLFKFGVMPNQPRPTLTEPLLPVIMYKLPVQSIVKRVVPVEDLYNIAWYRLQNGLAKASQGVYTINTTLLDAGGKKLDPRKVLKAMREDQVMFYKMGMNSIGGTPIPLSYVPGNLTEVLTNETAIMNNCMKLVVDTTGFSAISLGAAPDPKQLVGTTEQSLQQTQKSLLPITTALRYVKEELGRRTAIMWDLAIKTDPRARAEAAKVIGEEGVVALQISRDIDVKYGIHCVARPDETIKQAIIETANASFANKEISADERLFIIEQVTSDQNPREIRMKLRKMIQQNIQRTEMYKQQAIITQNKGLQETSRVQTESAERIRQADAQAKAAEIEMQGKTDILKRTHDSQMKREEMMVEGQLEQGKNNITK